MWREEGEDEEEGEEAVEKARKNRIGGLKKLRRGEGDGKTRNEADGRSFPGLLPESASEGPGTGYGPQRANGSAAARLRVLGPSGREMR